MRLLGATATLSGIDARKEGRKEERARKEVRGPINTSAMQIYLHNDCYYANLGHQQIHIHIMQEC